MYQHALQTDAVIIKERIAPDTCEQKNGEMTFICVHSIVLNSRIF